MVDGFLHGSHHLERAVKCAVLVPRGRGSRCTWDEVSGHLPCERGGIYNMQARHRARETVLGGWVRAGSSYGLTGRRWTKTGHTSIYPDAGYRSDHLAWHGNPRLTDLPACTVTPAASSASRTATSPPLDSQAAWRSTFSTALHAAG